MSSRPLTPESPRPGGGDTQDIPQLRLDDPSEVLEATAAPRQQGFARPRRGGGRGRTAGRSPSVGVSSESGSLRSSESGLLSPIQGASREGSPSPRGSPYPSPSPSRSRSRSRSRSPALSSRSQSLLRASRLFSDDDYAEEEDALMSLGLGLGGPEQAGGGGGESPADAFLDRFAEIQKENDEASRRYAEEIRSLRLELKKLSAQTDEQNQWIEHVEGRAQEMEGKNQALERENAILLAQLGGKEREVRALRRDVEMMEERERGVVILDEGGEGEGRTELTPGEANSRIKKLRGEIAVLKEGIRELKEERDRHGDELEVLWERKEQAEVVEKENVELKKEVERVRTEYVVLERQLVIEREATKKYEAPAEEKLAKVKESPVSEVFGSPGSPPGAKEGEVVVDEEVTARMAKLAEMIEDMKIKHEKEIENLELKIIEANYNIKVKEQEAESLQADIEEANGTIKSKNVEIKKLHDAAAGVVAQFGQLQEQTARYKEQTAELKARHEAQLNELNQKIAMLREKLQTKEKELAREKERYEAREKIRESNERDLRARLAQLERSDQKDVENLQKDLQEREKEIAKLCRKNEKLEDKNDQLHKNNQHLQQTVRNYRKGGADLPIRQTIANTQLWAEKNILRDSLENIKDRLSKMDPSEVDKMQPLKAISDELKQTRDRLKKEKDDWAKEDGEITAILRRIDGRNSQEHKHTPKISQRSSHFPSTQTEFMKNIEQLEQEQSAYITARHEEYTAMNAKRPLGSPLTAEEEERLHKLTREFVEKLPGNPMVAFLGGGAPQARRENQLWALTEKVKRMKIREGQDLHTWLPRLKPTIMEHKRRHAQLMRELHVLEADAEDVVQQINELTRPQPPEWEERGKKTAPLPEEEEEQDQDLLNKKEKALREKEHDLRREIRFAYSRLERLLYNRQLFEHWVETLEKRLNDEASGLVTQVLLEFELRHLLDKESKEACFCHLFEYFFPTAYESTVLGQGHSSPEKGKGKDDVEKGKPPGPKPEASSASLPGRPRTADLTRGPHRGKRIPRDGLQTAAGSKPAGSQEDDDDDVVVRSRAPARLVRGQSFGGWSVTTNDDPIIDEDEGEPCSTRSSPHGHGHGGGHLSLSISPESAKFLREHAYPYICQVMTSLVWFGLLLAIQPRNMFKTLSFVLSFVVGLPVYLVQFSRFYLAERGGLLSPGFVSRLGGVARSLRFFGKGEAAKQAEQTSRTEYVDYFEGLPLAGTGGLGIVLPKSAQPELQLRGGGGKRARKSKYRMKKDLTVPEDPEPGSGSEQQQEAEAEVEPSLEEEEHETGPPMEEEKPLVQEEEEKPLPVAEPEPTVEEEEEKKPLAEEEEEEEEKLLPAAEPELTGEEEEKPLVEEEAEEGLLTPTPVRVSPQLPPFMTTSEAEPKGKGKEKETEPAEGEGTQETVVPEDQQSGLAYPEESPPTLHPWPSLSGLTASEGGESEAKEKEPPSLLSSPLPSLPRTQRTSSQELVWGEAQWLAQAEERKQEEEALRKQQRSQKWWWRLWFWMTDLWTSFVQFLSVYRPFSSWTSTSTSSVKTGDILPTPPAQPTQAGSSGEDSPPLRWNRTPRWAGSSAFPGVQPRTSTTTPSPKFPTNKPPPKPSFGVSFLTFVETHIVQNIVRFVFAIRSFFTTAIVLLGSLATRLVDFSKQAITSTIIFLRTAISIPINLSRNLRERLPAPSLKPPYPIPKISNLRLSQLRPPKIHLDLPQVKASVKLPVLNLNLNLQLRRDQAKASFGRLRFRLPNPLQEIRNLSRQFQLPKIATPPRPPSPPTILGSLLSLFVIYTLLTYLACLAERRVWTSPNIAWKHAYLRDLELAAHSHSQIQTSSSPYSPSFIKSVFTSSSSPGPAAQVNAGGYPAWSPAKVDYSLLYAPAFWNLWYLPGDIASWGGEKVRPVISAWDAGLGGHYEDGLEAMKGGFRAVGERLGNVWGRLGGVLGVGILEGVDLRDSWRALGSGRWASRIKERIKIGRWLGSMENGWENVKWSFVEIRRWIKSVIEGCKEKIFQGSEYVKAVWSRARQLWSATVRPIREVREWLRETVGRWWKKIFEGGYDLIKESGHLGRVWVVPSRLAAAWSAVRGG